MAKFWRRKGRVARATGFEQIDGPPGASWPSPRPRGVAWATILYLLLSALAIGTILGIVAVAPLILMTFFLSGQWDALPAALSGFAIAAPFFFIQASSEEIMFRGWMMQTIAARHGALIGLVASSLLFALGHIDPGETILGMI